MRLTLRTLLAYLDDWLDPEDAVELGKRIEENKFATELVHRIRTRVRMLRLAAPKLDGKGIGLDPNSVAEYLDNTMPPDRVPDFEKVCLESDVHLAEVASCHQVLAIVQERQAPVDPALRQRMYRLIDLDPDAVGQVLIEPPLPDEAGDAVGVGGRLAEPLPPSFSVTTRSAQVAAASESAAGAAGASLRLGRLLGTVAAVFLLVVVSLRLMGPFDPTHPLAGLIGLGSAGSGGGSEVAQGDGTGGASGAAASDQRGGASQAAAAGGPAGSGAGNQPDVAASGDAELGPGAPGKDDRAKGRGAAGGEAGAADNEPADGGQRPARGTVVKGKQAAGGDADGEGDAQPGDVGNPVASGDAKPRPERPMDDPAVDMTDDAKPAGQAGKGAIAEGGRAGEPVGKPRIGPTGKTAAGKTAGGGRVPAKPMDEPAEAANPAEVGRYVSEEHVLARFNPADGSWQRLVRNSPLAAGDRVVSLPIYRPQIVLAAGAQVMLVGETEIEFRAGQPGDEAEVVLRRGRAVIGSLGKPGVVLPLNLGGRRGIARLVDVSSEMAIEVRNYMRPGDEPEKSESEVVVEIFARQGKFGWTPEGGTEEVVSAGEELVQLGQDTPVIERASLPAWTDAKSVAKLDRDASEQLEAFLAPDRPLTLSLEERTKFRQTEVRSLAARALAELGEYEAAIRELGTETQHSYWGAAVDALRVAMARSPESAARVRAALERLRNEDAAVLYRLLRDYSPEQLEKGGADELVKYLEHRALDVRVVAFETLRRITGSTLTYRPERTQEQQRLPLQQWKKRAKDGQVVYKVLPSPLPERKVGDR